MKKNFALLAALMVAGPMANAADIFVRDARGSDLSRDQVQQVTDMVKKAVRATPEHSLVLSEGQSDFVLQPSIVNNGDQLSLRIEKEKDGQVMAMSEEVIPSINASGDRAVATTQTALNDDMIASGQDMPASDTMSGSSSAMDDSTAANIGTESGVATSPTTDMGSGTMGEDTATLQSNSMANSLDNSASGTTSESSEGAVASGTGIAQGDVRAPSPALQREGRTNFFQIGVGPAFGLGMESDNILYNINAAYVIPYQERWAVKGFGDFNFATAEDAARFINLGIGGEFYPTQVDIAGGRPYVMADLGYAFTRNDANELADAPAIGAGAGFKFAAREVNMDVNLHYTLLTSKNGDDVPSVLGLRAALNF